MLPCTCDNRQHNLRTFNRIFFTHLQPPVKGPGDGDASGLGVLRGDRLLQLIDGAVLLELLDQGLDSLLRPLLLLLILGFALAPPKKALHNGRGERKHGAHATDGLHC